MELRYKHSDYYISQNSYKAADTDLFIYPKFNHVTDVGRQRVVDNLMKIKLESGNL